MINIQNKHYHLKIAKEGRIISFSKNNQVLTDENQPPLFTIRSRDKEGKALVVSALEAKTCDVRESGGKTTMRYGGFLQLGLTVEVTIEADEGPLLRLRIFAENTAPYCIEWISFPGICVPKDLTANGGEGKILWGYNEGVLVEDIDKRGFFGFSYQQPEYPIKSICGLFPAMVETQMMAYYRENGGLYMAAHDRSGHLKGIDFYERDNSICLDFRLYTGSDFNQPVSLDYDMILGVFDGDWYSAANIYREWLLQENPHNLTPSADNKALPQWYHDSPIVITYPVRGTYDTDEMKPNRMFPYSNAMPHIKRLEQELGSKLLVLLMHWEGTAPWAPPYVWPPYGGEGELRAFVDALHDAGHLIGVYCSGLGWTQQSNLISYSQEERFKKDNLASVMCISPEEELLHSQICTSQRSGYDLCVAQSFTEDTVVGEANSIISAGIDYIQILDQNHGGSPCLCYSKEHGHPPVPGLWMTDAMRNILQKLRQCSEKHNKKVVFGCESAASEPYMPYLLLNDNRFEINYAIGTPVPLYSYLYHPYIQNFMGNQVCVDSIIDCYASPENLYYRMAYSFIAGDMLTLVLNQDGEIVWNWGKIEAKAMPDQKATLSFAAHMNEWRKQGARDYLQGGCMQSPFSVHGTTTCEYKLQKNNYIYTAPNLLTSCWRAADGSSGQIIVNHTTKSASAYIEIKGCKAQIFHSPTCAGIDFTGEFTMKPLSAILIRVS